MSDTPRTDATEVAWDLEVKLSVDPHGFQRRELPKKNSPLNPWYLCRQLERENVALKAELELARKYIDAIGD